VISRAGVGAAALAVLLGCAGVDARTPTAGGDRGTAGGEPAAPTLALVGGTIVDLADAGSSTADVGDSVVLVRGDEIVAAGPRRTTRIPRDARIVAIDGAYVLPGLHDVFAGLNSQAQANAYLYKGVTSIVGGDEPGGRRGALVETAAPSPRIHRLGFIHGMLRTPVGPAPLDTAGILKQVEEEVARGAEVLLLHYRLDPEQVGRVVARARELGLPTIGELGHTTYTQGIAAGIDAFVHTSRYSLELATPEMRAAVAADPFGPPRTAFYEYLGTLDPDAPVVTGWAARLGAARTALIPTLSLFYYDLPEHENPWREPIAAILDPKGIHLPVDRETGARATPPGIPPGRTANLYRLEERYRRGGARYLAGSGTSAFGTLPGIALHLELRLLRRIGLTPRQALAAASSNVAEVFRWPQTGRVAAGHDADLLVVDADPTADLRNLDQIRMVVLRGEIVDRQALLQVP
jgi:imidazolonepropionase-like amidohydrolase